MSQPHAILAEYDTPADIMAAAETVHGAGFTKWDVHSPFPVHGMDEAMGLGNAKVGWFTFFGGLIGKWVTRQHAQIKPRRAPCHRRADTAAADDAQRFAVHIVPPFRRPFTGAHRGVRGVNAARDAEQQREGVIRHRLIEHTGRVSDHDAVRRSDLHINPFITHAPTRNNSQISRLWTGQ